MLKLGIIGMSEGNGHPYSWAAIFNGYNSEFMKECPFTVIPAYLSKQSFPSDAIKGATVTHIWTQDKSISEHIAKSSNIEFICDQMTDMIGQVDAVLLARDDPENHFEMSLPFIEAGLPIFIDKPLATNLVEAKKIFALQKYDYQIFTCSSLLFAKEFQPDLLNYDELGKIRFVDACIPKSWEKYSVHIIEPVLNLVANRGQLVDVTNNGIHDLNVVSSIWSNDLICNFNVLGRTVCPLSIRVFGSKSYQILSFQDTYFAFKQSLLAFVENIKNRKRSIPINRTLEVIEVIEKGFLN